MRTIVFAGGGTAGHVMPNIALIKELRSDYACVYVGGDGMERDVCRSFGVPFFSIDTVKFRRDNMLKNIGVPFKLHACVKSAKRALAEIKPCLVFSKGGYAALPVVLAAKVPVLSHESDFSPGLATKIAKRKSEKVLCTFGPCAVRFKNGVAVGAPLMQSLYRGKKDGAHYGLTGTKPVLTVVGGSSGAATLNDIVAAHLTELLKSFDVIHMVGKNKKGGEPQRGYCPIEFENDMPRLYATTDVMVTRAGANALAECIALKIPTIAVPLEKASRGDQIQNAEYYGGLGAVKVVREGSLSDSLCSVVSEVLRDKTRYTDAMGKIEVDGTKKIIELIKQYADGTPATA